MTKHALSAREAWRDKAHSMGGSRARRLPKTLTKEEVSALMRAPNLAVPTGLRDRCMLALMHRCGLRVSEVCGLYLRDVKWSEGAIHLRPENAKGGREAYVYLDDETLALLERWKDIRRPYGAGKPHLFVGVRQQCRGEPLDRRRVYEMMRRRAKKAGIERDVHPHMLRHTYATELLREGFNVVEVQKLMRHSRLATTSIYLHIQDSELAEKIRRRAA